MSRDALRALVQARVFNPTPRRDDLGAFHVPFESMVHAQRVESRLADSARRGDRTALIAGSGCGKSSVVSYVLGPTAVEVAPILVPVYALAADAGRAESVADAVIAQLRFEAATTTTAAPEFSEVTGERRETTRSSSRRRSFSGGLMSWLSGDLSREISHSRPHYSERILITEKIEVIEQCLRRIRADALQPVLVFDDTDRWADSQHRGIVSGFFTEGIRWLAELSASVIVATHTLYLDAHGASPDVLRFLDTRVEIPRVPSAGQLARILQRRVRTHTEDPAKHDKLLLSDNASLSEILSDKIPGVGIFSAELQLDDILAESALEELHNHYRTGVSLRTVLQIAHIASVEAIDAGADTIVGHHIKAAAQAW